MVAWLRSALTHVHLPPQVGSKSHSASKLSTGSRSSWSRRAQPPPLLACSHYWPRIAISSAVFSPARRSEDQAIVNAVREFGPRWCSVATCLPQRTEQAVRNRWNRLQQRARVQARALSIRRAAAAGAGQQGSESPQHSLGQTSPVCA